MGDRIPSLTRDDFPPEQQESYDDTTNFVQSMFGPPDQSPFKYKRSDGAFMGPLPFFLAAPEAGKAYMAMFNKLAAIPGFPPDAKEVAILAVGSVYKAAYELYAHTNVAVKKAGLSKEVAEAVARGEKPAGLNEQCDVAFDAARYLAGTPGPLPKEIWDRAMKAFGTYTDG